jgi:hypothetical protein
LRAFGVCDGAEDLCPCRKLKSGSIGDGAHQERG